MRDYPLHDSAVVAVAAGPDALFAFLDDPARLGAHMQRRNWRTAGMRMDYVLDERRGQAVGAPIGLRGRLFGLQLNVDEIVTERDPPRRKVWETTGAVELLVVGDYRMGFDIEAREGGAQLRVFIDYALPARWAAWPARRYARWCVRSMAVDAAEHFRPHAA